MATILQRDTTATPEEFIDGLTDYAVIAQQRKSLNGKVARAIVPARSAAGLKPGRLRRSPAVPASR